MSSPTYIYNPTPLSEEEKEAIRRSFGVYRGAIVVPLRDGKISPFSEIMEAILKERVRQSQKWGHTDFESVGHFVLNERGLPTDLPSTVLRFLGLRTMEVVLNEEVGEVSRAILEDDLAGLELELVQVAAVAVAMLEYLRRP